MSAGVCCPICHHRVSHVVETRSHGDTLRRRRACAACQARWTTSEELVDGSVVDQPLTRTPRKKESAAKSALRKPVKPAPDSTPARRPRALDDLTAEEDFFNTDDDVRVALEGMGHGR